ncbi:MAG: FAD-dependent oxidoreductase [Rhodobacteraceae bacterium]|nr:FAD-dependent oxidoreductase [Paracoccaceae bacterium]
MHLRKFTDLKDGRRTAWLLTAGPGLASVKPATTGGGMGDVWDVIVIGAGSAGLPLAIKAAERGAKILQLEADYRVGGTLYWSSGQIAGAGTRLQKQHGIEDSPAEHYRDAQRIAHGSIDPVVLKLTTEHAGPTIDWLMDLGFAPAPGTPVAGEAHEAYSTRRYLWGTQQAVSILNVLKPVHDKLVARGKIDLRLQHRMTGLMTDTSGAVIGVRAATPSGEQEFRGKNVVLASGGYAANAKLWTQLTPKVPLCSYCNPYSRGDGLVAARKLGAVVDSGDKFLCTFAGTRDNPKDPTSGTFLLLSPGGQSSRRIWEIFVDHTGKRFMQEDHPSIDYRERSLLSRKGMAMHVVFDHGIMQNASPIMAEPSAAFRARFGRNPNFVKAKTIAELARKLGVPAANLRKTVTEYNKAVDAKVDRKWNKAFLIRRIDKAPFYAIKAMGITVVSPAGLKVDKQLRVVGKSGKPIRNLYAAGEVLGFARTSGDSFVGGLSLTPALTFGRLLGEHLLKW